MLIDGVKYACEACKRGHRVSECTHSDRPLIVIPKKGRPPSQCPHCRTLRKSRSAHVKCACGDKKPLKPEEEQQQQQQHHLGCACRIGERCSCSLKTSHDGEISPSLDTIPEFIEGDSSSASLSPFHDTDDQGFKVPPKPALLSHKSDGSVHSVNGHHKPLHHHQHAGVHKYQPYNISKAHHGIHVHHHHGATRSVDSLPAAMKPAPQTEKDRLSRSEHNSPVLGPQSIPQPVVLDENWFDWELPLPSTDVFEPRFDYSYDSRSFFTATPTDDSTFASMDLNLQSSQWSVDDNQSILRSSIGSMMNVPQISYPDEASPEKAYAPQLEDLATSSSGLNRNSAAYTTEVDEIEGFLQNFPREDKDWKEEDYAPGGYVIGF